MDEVVMEGKAALVAEGAQKQKAASISAAISTSPPPSQGLKKKRKQDYTIPELNAQFTQAKDDIETKYAEKRKELETQLKRLDGKKACEIDELKEKHVAALKKRTQYEIRENAGTLDIDDDYACDTCGKELPRDASSPDDVDSGKVFICEGGEMCDSSYHCNEHKISTSTCASCTCDYCQLCIEYVKKCDGCWGAELLTCDCSKGDLHRMACGQLLRNENNCKFYHYKHCDCEEEARNAAIRRMKREW